MPTALVGSRPLGLLVMLAVVFLVSWSAGCSGGSVSTTSGAGTGGSSPPSSTPLVQHTSVSSSLSAQPSSYQVNFQPTQPGNALIFCFSGAGVSSASVSDSKGSNYTFILSQPGLDDGTNVSNCAYALNVSAGVTWAKVTFGGGLPHNVQAMVSEFAHVATASALDGSTTNSGTVGTITAGSFTPTTDGDLIYNYVVQDTGGSGSTTSFTTGASPWTMLSADIQDNMAAQYQIQTTAANINPTMTMTTSPANSGYNWSSIAFALKTSASAGTGLPSGIRVLRVQHEDPQQNGSFTVQMPCSGNLLVAAWLAAQGNDITGITDDHSNVWKSADGIVTNGSGGDGQIFYASNANCSATGTNVTITVGLTGSNQGSTIVLFDVTGAATSPFDTAANSQGDVESNTFTGTINGGGITPSTSNGLIIGEMGVDANSVTGLNSAGTYLSIVPTPFDADYASDENNGWMMYYNPNTSAYSSVWTMNAAPGFWITMFAAFKAGA